VLQLLASGRLPQPHLSFRSRVSELVELKRVSSPRSSRASLSTILDVQVMCKPRTKGCAVNQSSLSRMCKPHHASYILSECSIRHHIPGCVRRIGFASYILVVYVSVAS